MGYTPFKMKGFSGFGNSPMKQDKAQLVKSKKRKLTDREIRIAKNKEFNAYAEKQGFKPPQPKYGDSKALKEYEEFYSNKENLNMMKKEKEKYFKNKKK